MPRITVQMDETGNVDRLLQTMPDILQHKQLPKALRAASKPIISEAKQRVTPPGYPGDKPGLEPLRNTIAGVVRLYPRTTVAIIGCTWPEGNHGFLVEFGHDMKATRGGAVFGRVPPHPFMRPAIDSQQSASVALVIGVLRAGVAEFDRK